MMTTYAPCEKGLHVCGISADEEEFTTEANMPGISSEAFDRLAARFALPKSDDPDLVVDLFVGGDLVRDFGIRRQVLSALIRDGLELNARDMLEARIENGYPISACETPEMIAREMIEQSNPWPGVPFANCVAAVRSALAVLSHRENKKLTAMDLVATPLPEGALECQECGHIETDYLFLDTETCSKCGGLLTAVDFDD